MKEKDIVVTLTLFWAKKKKNLKAYLQLRYYLQEKCYCITIWFPL